MHCEQTEKVSLLVDGELASSEARALELHLLDCIHCQHARADFLTLRSQLSSYRLPLELKAPRPELAKLLSRSETTAQSKSDQQRRFGWLPATFDSLRFNPALAAVAALILVAITIAAIAVFRHEFRQSNPSDNRLAERLVSPTPQVDETSPGEKERRKQNEKEASQPNSNPSKPGQRMKPGKERGAPKQTPAPRSSAPPTYAISNDSKTSNDSMRAADQQTLTMRHLEQSELLLRAFRNVRSGKNPAHAEIAYERKQAQRLVYQNMMLRREAEGDGDVQVASLLESLEPILIDIANLPDKTDSHQVKAIQDRMERKSLVALLQVNSASVARANE